MEGRLEILAGQGALLKWPGGNTGSYNDASNFVSCECQYDSLCYADGRTTNAELAPALIHRE